jgi:phage terminase large subunit-like protein
MARHPQVKPIRYPAPAPLFPIAGPITGPLDLIPIVPDPTGRGGKAWNILKRLPITEGEHAGKRIGDNAPLWMPRLTKLIFGHTDENGLRVLREVFVSIGKKNGKSAFASAVATTSLLLEGEQREQVKLLAENRQQARICYDGMVAMVRADEELGRRFEIVDHRHAMRFPATSSRVEAVAADIASLVGFNPSLTIVDELHLLGRTPKGAQLVNQARTGSVARLEPLLFSISTAPPERSAGIFQSTLAKARRVIAGEEVDPHFFAWLCEIPEHLDPENPENWRWSNPSLGYTVTLERLIANRDSAKSDPEALRDFNSQNLNIQPDASAGEGRWIPVARWDEAADDTLTLDALLRECTKVGVGTDAGGLDDLAAVAVIGETDDGRFMVWTAQWLSRAGYEKRRTVNSYDDYVAAGELTIFDGGSGDVEGIAEVVATVAKTGKLIAIGIDSYGAVEMAEALQAAIGTSGAVEIVSVPQSWKLTPAVFWCERRLADGLLSHSGSTLLRWNMGNVVVTRRGNAVTISKATVVGAGKIDGVAAILTGVAAYLDAVTRAADNTYRGIYSNEAAYEAAFGRPPADDGTTWDAEVLKNMRHPDFELHKQRFERWQDTRADREDW